MITRAPAAAAANAEGSIDWLCLPHFDSPAIFLRLLDDTRGGYCTIRPSGLISATRRHRGDTNILEMAFKTATGSLLLTDFMPVRKRKGVHPGGEDVAAAHEIMRWMQCSSGFIDLRIEVKPTFSFATERAQITRENNALSFRGIDAALHVQSSSPLSVKDDLVSAAVRLEPGGDGFLVLSYTKANEKRPLRTRWSIQQALDETERCWREWAEACTYRGEYRDVVMRSALTLKLLTFEPTGAIVAAPTTSLPEEIGGVRNWDYRFTWLRDATFTLIALMNLGYLGEAHDFLHFLKRACACPAEEFQILYGIQGVRGSNPLSSTNIFNHLRVL